MRYPLHKIFTIYCFILLAPSLTRGASDSLEVARIYQITLDIIYKPGDVQIDSLLFYTGKGIDLSAKNNLPAYIVDFNTNIAYAYKRMGEYEKAFHYSSLAVSKALDLNHIPGIARSGYTHAMICFDKGDIQQSFEQISLNLDFARTHHLDRYMFVNYFLLAHINGHTNNHQITAFYQEKAFQFHSDSSIVQAFQIKSKLTNSIIKGNEEEADVLFRQFRSLILKSDKKPRMEEIGLMITIAKTYARAGNTRKAIELFEDLARKPLQDVEYPETTINANLAATYLKANMYPQAERVNPVADQTVRQQYNYDDYLTILKNEALIMEHKGLRKKALEAWKEIYTLEDSLSNVRNEISYLLVTHLKKLESLEDKFELVNQQNTQQRILLEKERKQKVLLLVLAILLLTLSGVIYSLFRRLTHSNHKIIEQNRAISAQTESLRKSNFIKDKLFSLMTHELRSPVAELITILDVNEWKNKDTALHPYLKNVNRKAKTIYTTLDNILIWSSSQLKNEKTEMKPIDMRNALEAGIALNHQEIEHKNIVLVNEVSPTLLLGNVNYLMIILRNILSNAVKFTPASGVIRLQTIEDPEYTGVLIEDSGAGIAPEKLKSLFVTVQDSEEGTSGEKGSGVGLVLCKDLVDKLRGKIEITSTLNQGTSVKLLFLKA